jgi:hypothetical protein
MHGVIVAALVIMAIAAIRQVSQQYWQHVPDNVKRRLPKAPAWSKKAKHVEEQ